MENTVDSILDAFEAAESLPNVENMTAEEIMTAVAAKEQAPAGTPGTVPEESLTPEEAAKVEESLTPTTPVETPPAVSELETVKAQLGEVNQKYQSLLGRIEKELKPVQGLNAKYGDITQYEPFLDEMQRNPRFREHMLGFFKAGQEDDFSGVDLTDPKQAREFYRKEALRAVEEREQAIAAQNAKSQADRSVQGFAQGFQTARQKAVQEQKIAEADVDAATQAFWADFHKGDVVKYAVTMNQLPKLLAEAEAKGKTAGIEEMRQKIADAKAGGKRTVTVPTTTAAKTKIDNTGAGGDGSGILEQMKTVKPFSDEWNKMADDYEAVTGKPIFG